MMLSKKSVLRKGATLALMTAMVFGAAVPASAEQISQGIIAGELTATLSAPSFDDLTFSREEQFGISDPFTLTVNDLRGQASPAGWRVTLAATELDGPGAVTVANTAISINSLGTISPADAVTNDGYTGAVLSEARTVINASAGNGNTSAYTEDITLKIVLPGNSPLGAYVGTITATTAAAL